MMASLSRPLSISPLKGNGRCSTSLDLKEIECSQIRFEGVTDKLEQREYEPLELGVVHVMRQSPGPVLMEINVCMSPEVGPTSLQTCLTPSEWQSVNDMPRVNRTPLTQRITPMKDRVVERSKNKSKNSRSTSETINDTLIPSSNCSTSSSRNGYNVAENTTSQSSTNSDQELIPFRFFKTGFDCIKSHGSDGEDNINCGCSDISYGDMPSPTDVTGPDQYCERKKCSAESDNSAGGFCSTIDKLRCFIRSDNESISESDSDSDNDLGHFYSPHATSADNYVSSTVPAVASLGYISSYPSINHDSNRI